MSLANIANLPLTETDVWAFSNLDHHRLILGRIQDEFGLRLNLYPLDPMPIDEDINFWLRRHQTMHNEMTSVLGISGFDLTSFNIQDQAQVQAWTWLHFVEHQEASQLLGVS